MNKTTLGRLALSAILGTSLLSACAAPAAEAAVFPDARTHWGAATIAWAIDQGIVNGYEDGTFRPDREVSEPEFLAMLLRAYPDAGLGAGAAGASWAQPYYTFAASKHWPVNGEAGGPRYNRGHVARLIAATQAGKTQNMADSIRYLLDQGLSQGKTAATVDGYAAGEPLSRAEAVQFIRNLKQKVAQLKASTSASDKTAASAFLSVRNVSLGDSAAAVTGLLGEPARKDAGEYNLEWYIYNADYANYAQIGLAGGKVVALYSPSANWQTSKGIADGSSQADVQKQYGRPLSFILKGNTQFMLNASNGEYDTYDIDGAYVTFFYDKYRSGAVTGVQVVGKATEQALTSFYPKGSDALARAFERQSFDLANASRVKLGLAPFVWSDATASTARKHSTDMAVSNFFDHTNLKGQSPFDRMKADGIAYSYAAENIAAGQTSAIFAHHGWMNSEGHRKNLLSSIRRLGVGVAFGGKMSIYYTQNFLTP